MCESSRPPLCVQILSLLVLIFFGLYCVAKGSASSTFSWWLLLGTSCLLATAFASFRLYEDCKQLQEEESDDVMFEGGV